MLVKGLGPLLRRFLIDFTSLVNGACQDQDEKGDFMGK